MGPAPSSRDNAPLVYCHRNFIEWRILQKLAGPGFCGQAARRSGKALGAAGLLFRVILVDVLAGRAFCDCRGSPSFVARAAFAPGSLPSRVDRPLLAGDRGDPDQTAPLRAAALPGYCDSRSFGNARV